jgi:hypothetical protein
MTSRNPHGFRGDIAVRSKFGLLPLNNSPDWITVYYRKRCSLAAWDRMPDGLEVASAGIAWRLTLAKASSISRVCSDEGIWIKALDPRLEWSDAAELSGLPEQYPLEVQIQGHAWSKGVDALDLLSRIEEALGLVDAPRICGRIDLASDFSMSAKKYAHLICGGSIPKVYENWVSRARSSQIDSVRGPKKLERDESGEPFTASVVGQYHTTLYLGARSGIQLSIYRKDVEFEGNTGALLRDRWRKAGWEPWGEGVVIRVEVRFSREWIREHKIGEVNGRDATPEMVLERAGALWRLATDQFRLAPQKIGGPKQRRDRPVSKVWTVIQESWDEWEFQDTFAPVEQTPDENKLIETTGKRIEDCRLVLSAEHFDQVMVDLFRGLPLLGDYKRNKSRWRKYANGKQ